MHWLSSEQLCGELDNSGRTPPSTPPHGATREVTQTRSRQAGIAPHTDANATALPTRTTRSIVRRAAMSCGAVLKHDAPPKLGLAQLSHTARRCTEHTQTVHQSSNL